MISTGFQKATDLSSVKRAFPILLLHLTHTTLFDPKILLSDKPDDALDLDGRNLVSSQMAKAQATTLCVIHDLALARAAEQIWMIADGQLVATDKPASLMSVSGQLQDFVCVRDAA